MGRKRTSNREVKRLGHKSARQAEKESLRGQRPDVVKGMEWPTRVPQPHVPDECVTGGPRKVKKNKKKWCKGHVGIEHNYQWRNGGNWRNTGWICTRCTKRYWGTPPGKEDRWAFNKLKPRNDHYAYNNIWLRLNGFNCKCDECLVNMDDSTAGDSTI